MIQVKRYDNNPILIPDRTNNWEADAVFNGCVVEDNGTYHMLYRALSGQQIYRGIPLNLSTIGYAKSNDFYNFTNRRLFIKPEHDWELFGCEDPRITKIDDTFYIFYTAISNHPPDKNSIKIALATTKDFMNIQNKGIVTNFNSKAMALFPKKINGKYAAILTAHTDNPPSKIALAYFDTLEQITDVSYWNNWHHSLSNFTIPLQRSRNDQIEVGAPPLETDKGWLVIYSYIRNYFNPPRIVGIEAVLLDKNDPRKIIGHTQEPLLVPEKYYELYGIFPDIVFPSSGIIQENTLYIYYGGADTNCSVAEVNLAELIAEMTKEPYETYAHKSNQGKLVPFEGNPLLRPIPNSTWEDRAVFNAASIELDNKIHIVYRGMNKLDQSALGYAVSSDGIHIDHRDDKPIYTGKEIFETNKDPKRAQGCEDPRLTLLDDKVYMIYTAYNGIIPRVAMTKILKDDFISSRWDKWEKPIAITDPETTNKDACLFPEKIHNKYYFLHRIEPDIWIDAVTDLEFKDQKYLKGKPICSPRDTSWDSVKIGAGPTPIKTDLGWLVIYHGISAVDSQYRLGYILLDLEDPSKIIYRSTYPILEEIVHYVDNPVRPGTVFTNGAVVKNNTLIVYYGASDAVLAVARINMNHLLKELKASL